MQLVLVLGSLVWKYKTFKTVLKKSIISKNIRKISKNLIKNYKKKKTYIEAFLEAP